MSSQTKEMEMRIVEHLADGTECCVREWSPGHFDVAVVSGSFAGKNLLARHRILMDLFAKDLESGDVHALRISQAKEKIEP